MEEIAKQFGLSGVVALVAAIILLFWRIKFPQIAVEYLQRELEISRGELGRADKERVSQRLEITTLKLRIAEIDRDYISCLTDREKCRRHIKAQDRQIRELGATPIVGDEEQH